MLNALDVFCLPSLWEGLSISLLEAMAMGKAIVATPTDGTREVIQDGITGSVVPFDEIESIADSLLYYYDHRDIMARHGKNARHLVLERFESRRVSSRVEKIYHEVIKIE